MHRPTKEFTHWGRPGELPTPHRRIAESCNGKGLALGQLTVNYYFGTWRDESRPGVGSQGALSQQRCFRNKRPPPPAPTTENLGSRPRNAADPSRTVAGSAAAAIAWAGPPKRKYYKMLFELKLLKAKGVSRAPHNRSFRPGAIDAGCHPGAVGGLRRHFSRCSGSLPQSGQSAGSYTPSSLALQGTPPLRRAWRGRLHSRMASR